MEKYKVCILAAGVGSRMGKLSQHINKAILPINSKAVISHIIEKFDKDIEFVVAVGHKKETVVEYIQLAHSDRKVNFVEVDKYFGPGTGPGYSLSACKELLQTPFIFFAADTIVLEDIPSLEKNWFGIAPVKRPEQYCTVRIKDNLVVEIVDKVSTNNKFAFIGLAGVKDYKIFFDSLDVNKEINSGEIQVSNGFKSLLERGLEPVGFTWFDTGTLENFNKTNNHLSGDDEKYDFSKGDEFLFFVENKVIKYFADKKIAEDRVHRANLLSGLTPKIESNKNNYYCYEKVDGDVLYDVMNEGLVYKFLDWCNHKLWIQKSLDDISSSQFKNACEKFYQEKTRNRLNQFYNKIPFKDSEYIVNGKRVPKQSELFQKIDWDYIIDGTPSVFHGDLQFDNVIYNSNKDTFTLIDWRQDFGGLLEFGDIYYDLSKLYGGMNLSYKNIKKNKFSFDMSDDKVFYSYEMSSNLLESKEVFEDFVVNNGYDLNKIKLLTGIIYLNMAPLHHDPFDHLLFFLGKNMIYKQLQKNNVEH